MAAKESLKLDWLDRLSEKVPAEVAGPVIVLIFFLGVSPSVLTQIHNNTSFVYLYLILMAFSVGTQGVSVIIYSVSRYHERERKSWSKAVKDLGFVGDRGTAVEIRSQIEEATAEERKQNE